MGRAAALLVQHLARPTLCKVGSPRPAEPASVRNFRIVAMLGRSSPLLCQYKDAANSVPRNIPAGQGIYGCGAALLRIDIGRRLNPLHGACSDGPPAYRVASGRRYAAGYFLVLGSSAGLT